MSITNRIHHYWCRFQAELFPEIQNAIGPLPENHQRFVYALEMVHPENFIRKSAKKNDRPLFSRINIARAFLAKPLWNIPTTRVLVERLMINRQLRNLCGWVLIHEIPSESTFSRVFAEFSKNKIMKQGFERSTGNKTQGRFQCRVYLSDRSTL